METTLCILFSSLFSHRPKSICSDTQDSPSPHPELQLFPKLDRLRSSWQASVSPILGSPGRGWEACIQAWSSLSIWGREPWRLLLETAALATLLQTLVKWAVSQGVTRAADPRDGTPTQVDLATALVNKTHLMRSIGAGGAALFEMINVPIP